MLPYMDIASLLCEDSYYYDPNFLKLDMTVNKFSINTFINNKKYGHQNVSYKYNFT